MSLCILNILFQLATVHLFFCGRFGKKIYEIGKIEGYFGMGIGEKFGPTRKAENPLRGRGAFRILNLAIS